jgi:hypothetical protein
MELSHLGTEFLGEFPWNLSPQIGKMKKEKEKPKQNGSS